MQGIKEFNKKITSLKNTRKITKTMKMVSASKFKRANVAQVNAQLYATKLSEMMTRLLNTVDEPNNPYLKPRRSVKAILVLLLTSDRGLCGGFNHSIIRQTRIFTKQMRASLDQVDLSCCGKRGHMAFRKGHTIKKFYTEAVQKPSMAEAIMIARDLCQSYVSKEYDEIYLAYNHFKSAMSQTPVIEKLLPLDLSNLKGTSSVSQAYYLLEPAGQELVQSLIPQFINFRIFYALLENAAGEQGARMTAMESATDNCTDLISKYTLLRNRARQASITKELIEIISGAEALHN